MILQALCAPDAQWGQNASGCPHACVFEGSAICRREAKYTGPGKEVSSPAVSLQRHLLTKLNTVLSEGGAPPGRMTAGHHPVSPMSTGSPGSWVLQSQEFWDRPGVPLVGTQGSDNGV